MEQHYSRKQAMERLGVISLNTFLRIARKHPEVFVNVNPNTNKDKHPWYDKAAVDKFAETQAQLMKNQANE